MQQLIAATLSSPLFKEKFSCRILWKFENYVYLPKIDNCNFGIWYFFAWGSTFVSFTIWKNILLKIKQKTKSPAFWTSGPQEGKTQQLACIALHFLFPHPFIKCFHSNLFYLSVQYITISSLPSCFLFLWFFVVYTFSPEIWVTTKRHKASIFMASVRFSHTVL